MSFGGDSYPGNGYSGDRRKSGGGGSGGGSTFGESYDNNFGGNGGGSSPFKKKRRLWQVSNEEKDSKAARASCIRGMSKREWSAMVFSFR